MWNVSNKMTYHLNLKSINLFKNKIELNYKIKILNIYENKAIKI